jgi:uncharacterized membrane protein YozB (DUF420 family)
MTRETWCPYKASLPLLRKEGLKMESRTIQKTRICGVVFWIMTTCRLVYYCADLYPEDGSRMFLYILIITQQAALVARSVYLAFYEVSNKSV